MKLKLTKNQKAKLAEKFPDIKIDNASELIEWLESKNIFVWYKPYVGYDEVRFTLYVSSAKFFQNLGIYMDKEMGISCAISVILDKLIDK